jgi:hypothetical protein
MKFLVVIDKMVGCGVPGCGEGCDDALKFHLHATSKEDAAKFVANYLRDMDNFNLKSNFWETSTEDPEMSVMLTPSFESEQWKNDYEDATFEMNKAREELHVLIKYGATRDVLDKAMNKFQQAVEYCAFLRGG